MTALAKLHFFRYITLDVVPRYYSNVQAVFNTLEKCDIREEHKLILLIPGSCQSTSKAKRVMEYGDRPSSLKIDRQFALLIYTY